MQERTSAPAARRHTGPGSDRTGPPKPSALPASPPLEPRVRGPLDRGTSPAPGPEVSQYQHQRLSAEWVTAATRTGHQDQVLAACRLASALPAVCSLSATEPPSDWALSTAPRTRSDAHTWSGTWSTPPGSPAGPTAPREACACSSVAIDAGAKPSKGFSGSCVDTARRCPVMRIPVVPPVVVVRAEGRLRTPGSPTPRSVGRP